jgi:hypothetical protein
MPPADSRGLSYKNFRVESEPWSIHVVRLSRSAPGLEIHSFHARGLALGLGTISSQAKQAGTEFGTPVAAINGDFYQRDRAYAGHPRGLQIAEGEILSEPTGGASFWIDAYGHARATNVVSRFRVAWPNGVTTSCGLNEDRGANRVTVYTPSAGASTKTSGGREIILERVGDGPWLPLQMGEKYEGRVREVRKGGNTPLTPEIVVLSMSPASERSIPEIAVGAVVKIATDSTPALRGAKTALSGGPVLVRNRRAQPIEQSESGSYSATTMFERHPRSAVGWNNEAFFLVEVDGRQKYLSVGMTLDELARFLVKLGCDEAMNLDGGGSATLWFDGETRNSPCDGREREIANTLVFALKDRQANKANDRNP